MHRIRQLVLLAALSAAALSVTADPATAADRDRSVGAVYTLTNSPSGNAVAVFDRASDGSLTPRGTVPTGGIGSGAASGHKARSFSTADACSQSTPETTRSPPSALARGMTCSSRMSPARAAQTRSA